MNKRIAFQFFGQLRYVEIQNSLDSFINFFIKKGFDVDLYATFWDDEYTREKIKGEKFTNFKSVKLIIEPDLKSGDLEKYFYSLEKTLEQRNKKYDFIIFSRYDNYFGEVQEKEFDKFYDTVITQSSFPSIFFSTNALLDDKIDDKFFICNQYAADKICLTYSKYKNKEFNIPYLRYHKSLLESIKFFNLELHCNIDFFIYILYRHKFQKEINLDQTLTFKGELLRDYIKKFQNFYEMKKFIEKVTN